MATRKQNPPGESDAVLAPEKSRAKLPPLYRVMLLNDDFTPMDFVVVVLEKFFGMNREQATLVMLKVHREGKGMCGLYPRDVAATKVEQVEAFARQYQHPLACVMEEN
jgi:ATP-dependent Clp protease adaptor protein ClpS